MIRIRISDRSTAKYAAEMKCKPTLRHKQQKTKRRTVQRPQRVTDVVWSSESDSSDLIQVISSEE